MKSLHILIIDQSISYGRELKQGLLREESLYTITTTHTIQEALTALARNPDVVLLDVSMPNVEGIPAVQAIVQVLKIPVIVMAGSTVQEAAKTISAISGGATDYIRKPSMSKAGIDMILAKIKFVSATKYHQHTRPNKMKSIQPTVSVENMKPSMKKKHRVIVIGTSTGGPRALQQVIQGLPDDFQTPILIVQHMPSGFTKSLADRLNRLSSIKVKEATHGDVVQKGHAYVAPGNFHLLIKEAKDSTRLFLELSTDGDHLPHRPSVDVLFESLAVLDHVDKVAVVLTGMGKDGRNGVITMKEYDQNAVIIAESLETAIIDGMPKAVIDTNLVTEIIRIEDIGDTLKKYDVKRGD